MKKAITVCVVAIVAISLCGWLSGCRQELVSESGPSPAEETTPGAAPAPEPATIPEPEAAPEQIQASDGQVTIVLDKIERAEAIPSDIAEELHSIPTPDTGNDFVCVYITIARIENVHVVNPLGFEDERSILLDPQNNEYEFVSAFVKGISYLDPHDIRGPCEAVEGATGFLVFEVPKHEKPLKISYIYSFKASWQEETAKRGQIDLILGS